MKNTNTSWSDKSDIKYPLAVVIGRFQPFHNGHLALIKKASQIGDQVLVLLGSAHAAPNIKNPFTFLEREQMIYDACEDEGIKTVRIEPITDNLYSDNDWIKQIQAKIDKFKEFTKGDDGVVIVGHHKDDSSYYLDIFPNFDLIKVPTTEIELDSTTIRSMFFGNSMIPMQVLPRAVEVFLFDYMRKNKKHSDIAEEYKFIQEYKTKFANAPFAPTFVTTDAVVLNNGYILLVKRRMAPGKGLWALPGGFLNQNERIVDGTIRELQEETRIKVSADILYRSIRDTHVFDAPGRSLRGRTITHASLIQLYESKLPGVRGSDDAERAKWFSINDLYKMQEKMYEDHFSIATYFINKAE
jgi:bifunctional NMN adenylyltransferase/nudix hydrolase